MVVKRKKQQLQSAAASEGGREGEGGVVQTRPQTQLSSAESQPPATAPQWLHLYLSDPCRGSDLETAFWQQSWHITSAVVGI